MPLSLDESTIPSSSAAARSVRWLRRLTDSLLVAAFSLQVMAFWSVGKEDAFICYRYARNLVRGDGLVYNPGEYVEGISNLLWTLVLALLVKLGVPIDAADNLMVLFFAVAAFLVFRRVSLRAFGDTWAARLPLFLLVCMTALPAGFGNGLEGSAVACAVALMLAGAVASAPWTMTLGAVMMFTLRPEGIVYAVWAMAWLLAVSWRERALRWRVFVCAATVAAAFAALTIFRLAYYGDYLPNTVRAKAEPMSWTFVDSGTNYLKEYFWRVGPVLLLLAATGWLWRRWRGLWLFASGMAALNLAVAWRNGGDWMGEFRLVAPFYGLLAFMAAISAHASRAASRRAGAVVGALCLAGGLWTLEPHAILLHAPELRFTVVNMWNEPVDFDRLFDPHLTLADFREKDERVLLECGGGPGYAFDGVPVIEMWGLADRDIAGGKGPGTYHVPGSGRICWPAAFAKNPTHLLLWQRYIPGRISSIAEVPELRGKIARFLAVQDVAFDKELRALNLIFFRSDRPALSKCLLHYGAIAPALDYDDPALYGMPFLLRGSASPPDNDESLVRTPWQKGGWTVGDGSTVPTEWLRWDDDQRLSSRLLLQPGTNRFTRELPDDAPIAFVFGRFPLFAPHVRVSVFAERGEGGRVEVATAEWVDGTSSEFILDPLLVSDWHTAKPLRVTVELDSDTACGIFMAAHRWTHEPFPQVPGRYVADTRLEVRSPLQVPDMPNTKTAVAQQRVALTGNPYNQTCRFLLGAALSRDGDWSGAEPLLRQTLSLDRGTWLAGASIYAEEARRRYKSGNPKGAAELLSVVRILDPEYLGYALQLAEALNELGEPDGALAQCREVLAVAPESPRTADLFDSIYRQRGDANGCASEWRAIAREHPKAVLPWQRLAEALGQAGDPAGAGEAKDRAETNAGGVGS